MKKLMIAAAAVALAASVQAASVAWSSPMGITAYNDTASSAAGTAYLMKSSDAAGFISSVLGAKGDYASQFATLVASAANSATYAGEFSNPASGAVLDGSVVYDDVALADGNSFYQVILDTANKGVFISEVATVESVSSLGNNDVMFMNLIGEAEAIQTFGKDVTTYQGAGWYTADVGGGDVPEPTSAMLMLLGVAGLALRRKQK